LMLELIGGVFERSTNAAFPGQDGKIAFRRLSDGKWAIFAINPDGSGLTMLTSTLSNNSFPAWSADGSKIVFVSHRDGNLEIYSMNADGSDVTNLSQNPAFDADPAWSPDESMITFATDRNGRFEIAVMNADGSGQTVIASGSQNGFPDWQPLVSSVITILVDIKPGSTTNPINLRSHGVI